LYQCLVCFTPGFISLFLSLHYYYATAIPVFNSSQSSLVCLRTWSCLVLIDTSIVIYHVCVCADLFPILNGDMMCSTFILIWHLVIQKIIKVSLIWSKHSIFYVIQVYIWLKKDQVFMFHAHRT